MSITSEKKSVFSRFPKYLMWWLVFGFVGGALQPVTQQLDQFWRVKLYQALSGLPFGLIAAVMFSLAQNLLNVGKKRSYTWSIAIVVWIVSKLLVFGIAWVLAA